MTSRLDRLYHLLESGGQQQAVRKSAAVQIGELARSMPHEAPQLLQRLAKLLRSRSWDTRVAAGQAVLAISAALAGPDGNSRPPACQRVRPPTSDSLLLQFEELDFAKIVRTGARLLSSDAETVDETGVSQVDRASLEQRLGLDERVSSHLGGSRQLAGIEDDDLRLVGSSGKVYSTMSVESAVEFVRQDSRSRKRPAESEEDSASADAAAADSAAGAVKFVKLESIEEEDQGDDQKVKLETEEAEVKQSDSVSEKNQPEEDWVFAEFANSLVRDMWHQEWEVRHGVAVGLRELLRHHRRWLGRRPCQRDDDEESHHQRCVEDLSLRLLCTLALDQLSDFVSDEVIAPVRETCGQVLGLLSTELTQHQLGCVVSSLLCLSRQPHWMISYGGLLGIKYILASRPRDAADLLPRVYSEIFNHIAAAKDDDVMASALSALVPVSTELCNSLPDRLPQLVSTLWDLLARMDDLSPATNTILSLLTALQAGGVSPDQFTEAQLSNQLQTLLPFLYDSLRSVRETAGRAVAAFASAGCACGRLPPACLAAVLRHLYQRCLLEELPETRSAVRASLLKLLDDLSDKVGQLAEALLVAENLTEMLALATQPSRQEFLEDDPFSAADPAAPPATPGVILGRLATFESRPSGSVGGGSSSSSGGGGGGLYIGGSSSLSDSVERRETVVLEARLFALEMLSSMCSAALRPAAAATAASAERGKLLAEKIRQLTGCYLVSKLATHRFVAGLFCSGLSEVSAAISGDESNSVRQGLLRCLTEVVYFEESLLHFKQMQLDCRLLLGELKEAGASAALPNIGPVLSLEACKTLVGPAAAKLTAELRARVAAQLSAASVSVDKCSALIGLLNMRVQSSLAAALCLLVADLPDRVSPVIKPLMDSLRAEENARLQRLSADALAQALLLLSAKPSGEAVADKIVKNLSAYLRADTALPTVAKEEIVAIATMQQHQPEAVPLETRGGQLAFQAVCRLFGHRLATGLPALWRLLLDFPAASLADFDSLDSAGVSSLLTSLMALDICCDHLDSGTFDQLSSVLLPLCRRHPGPLSSADPRLRHAAARLVSAWCRRSEEARSPGVQLCLDWLSHSEPACRLGAAELSFILVRDLDLLILPYLALLLLPCLGRMSDQNASVRSASAKTFGRLLRLLPLEATQSGASAALTPELVARRDAERGFIDCLLHPSRAAAYSAPVAVKAQLRSYQQKGVNWLVFLRRYGLNGVLADDLGLGKTLMTICALAGEHRERLDRFQASNKAADRPLPSLVVCPATLTGHWQYEMEKFISDEAAQPLVVNGNRQTRRALIEKFVKTHKRSPVKSGCTILITSFDAVRKDAELFGEVAWNYCILDEGHIIKNPKSKLSLAVKSLRCQHRLVLTGTPIQNGVHELWAIFDFLMPGYLGTESEFSTAFAKPIQGSRDVKAGTEDQTKGTLALEALHRQTLPFMLRRLKEDVLRDLPPKICQDYYCQLSPLQAQLYEKFCRNSHLGTGDSDSGDNRQHIFQALHFLRKICNHPALVLGSSPQQQQQHKNVATVENSGKFLALRQLLSDIGITGDSRLGVVSQHRVLLFAQTKATLDLVEKLVFKDSDMQHLRLDGSVPPADRHSLVQKFNSDPSIDALLLTTSVGGLGLNLTGADTVIFVDHDWNPMRDLQAMDRAHRIGQTRAVSVYRLLTRDTIEEKIMKYQKFKTAVANSVVNADNACVESLGTEQLLDLFEFSCGSAASGKSAADSRDSASRQRAKQAMSKTLGSVLSSMSAASASGASAAEAELTVDYEEEFDMSQFVQLLS
ncbi:hypothetical protein BOX15_Mlig022785g1 [Macrostomum lignano]|uniref:Uncharacterized protein n=1 Tax=Macrostomum lignano TaxID=282301 RepID=A0A267GYJ6_9PLAT|nr:hypothetical protein BOX15_Mlig022785g1 [Macrostomum lignano]